MSAHRSNRVLDATPPLDAVSGLGTGELKQLRWDRHFLDLALQHARISKDPSTQVGSIIVGPDLEFLSAGANGFPRGILDTPQRLNDRDTKLKIVVHAEVNYPGLKPGAWRCES